MRRLILAALLSTAAAPALSAEPAAKPWRLHDALDAPPALKLSGSIRTRYETIDGQARATLPSRESFASIRTIIGAEYDVGSTKFVAELWDSRVYGAKRGGSVSTGEVNPLEFVQAYALIGLKAPLGSGSKGRLQLGRFLLNIGSRRLVAADDYRNTTNGYTGAKLDLTAKSGAAVTFFYVLPQQRRPDDASGLLHNQVVLDQEGDDEQLWGALATHPAARLGMVEAGFVGFDERDAPRRPTRDRRLRTVTARLIRNPAPRHFDYEAEADYQFGQVSAGTAAVSPTLDVSASFIHLDAGYQFGGGWKPHLSLEYDRASGDKGGGRYNRFDTLFGMRRADLAPGNLYNALARTNIATPGLRLEVTPSKTLDGFVALRTMRLASATDAFSATAVRDASGRSGSHAGEQVEGRVRYWLVQDLLRLEADAAWLHKGRFLETAPNANRARDTAYLSLNLTANF